MVTDEHWTKAIEKPKEKSDVRRGSNVRRDVRR
jgi:hypothetical protein